MLAKRIIPCLDVKDGRVVKGVSFVNLRDAGDPVAQAVVYDCEGADELVFLDITASHERRATTLAMVRAVADAVFIPFTVGGGVGSVDDIRATLRAGADKVAMNTAAMQNPQLIGDGAEQFGVQCIVVAIDAKRKTGNGERGTSWEVFIHGGRTPTGRDVVAWAREAEQRGAGEILLTSMDEDGQLRGYDIALTRAVAQAVRIPVIASGGAGRREDFHAALTDGGASAALAASLFHDRKLAVREVKEYLLGQGVAVRPI
ncbi:MAG: imidazole glycerol phosphate synthase subunit HisF [Chloroflexota bacterium]